MASTVSYKSSAFHSKMGAGVVDPTSRDYREQCEQLRKELERKDQRNEKMIKEMQVVRASYADLQREMRLTVSTIDKIKTERKQFEEQVKQLREKNKSLAAKLETAHDPSTLFDQISKNRQDQLFLNENIVNLRGELGLRESKIEALRHELVIAHRALDAQSKYEHLMQPNVANSREIMRTLYFDMGKKQADLHSVTLSFAEITQKLQRVEAQLAQATEVKELLYIENEKLKGNVEHWSRQSVDYSDELERLRGEIDRGDRLCVHLEQRLEHASAEIETASARHVQEMHDKQVLIDNLSTDVAMLRQDKEDLLARLQHAHASAVTNDEIMRTRETDLMDQVATLQAQNADLAERLRLHDAVQEDSNRLRTQLAGTESQRTDLEQRLSELLRRLSEKEQESAKASISVHSLEAHLSALHVELSTARDQGVQAAAERDEALDALRHTMRATRDLSQRLQQERELRENVERTNEQLLQAKANLSVATLDALYQERRKSAALEKSLALVPLVLKWRSACLPPSRTVDRATAAYARSFSSSGSVEEQRSSGGAEEAKDAVEGAVTQQAAHDLNTVAKSVSDIASKLDTSEGLHEGVNATFDWLLEESNNVSSVPSAASAREEVPDAKDEAAYQQAPQPTADQGEVRAPDAGVVDVAAGISGGDAVPAVAPVVGQTAVLSSPRGLGVAAAMAEAYRSFALPSGQLTAPGPDGSVLESPGGMVTELRR